MLVCKFALPPVNGWLAQPENVAAFGVIDPADEQQVCNAVPELAVEDWPASAAELHLKNNHVLYLFDPAETLLEPSQHHGELGLQHQYPPEPPDTHQTLLGELHCVTFEN